ncbi:PAS domain S-box protein [Dongia deserti]|uniref:PAS domain S-box protein n=1 Tax=Dongia deserti TaxID=2268030 RepID=UPI000E6538AD|nr:PAS domain S-box protein [Dongia deserti]
MTTSLRTLIIDDSADDTDLLIRELRRDGYDISAERTDTEAGLKAALDDQSWDIVLCDFNMPHFSGLDALKVVRERNLDVPFIFVSGAIGEDVAVAAMKAGAQDYVMKGNLKRLAPAIERELRDSAVRRDRTAAEGRRRMMEARYRQILSIAPDAIVAMDQGLHIAVFNQAAERLFGCSAEEAIGHSVEMLLPARFVAPVREQIQRFGASSDVEMQIRVPDKLFARRKNGQEFPAEAYISKMVEDDRTIFTAIIRDITDRETMMATLRQANQTLDAVVQSSPIAILGLDGARRVIVWNRNAERIFGLSATDVVGRPFPPLVEVAGTELGDMVRRLLEGEVLTDVEIRHQPSTGTPLELRVFGAPLYDGEQHVRGAVCIVEDVTESKATRRQLEHAHRMEAVGQLTGGLAHDFNNLLAVVIGNLDLLQDQPELQATARESVDLALKAALGGATLIRQLLAFSRRQALSPKPFDLGALVASTRALLSRTLGEHIEVEMRLAPDLWAAMADAAQVESAIANLAINARDAMANGGRLTLETANQHLDEEYAASNPDAQPGDYVMLAVSDTGTGISSEILNRVFEPFFTTKEHGKGSGLGLSMVYGFARQSRGHVKIYSEVGHGTTVRLYLPRAGQDTAVAAPPAPAQTDPDKIDAAVLVVEDNIDVRKIVCRLLRDFGCTVIEANSGAAALEILQSDQKIDLMFSDVVMPGGMSGTELVQAARRLRPEVRTLLTTGFAEGSLRNQAQFANAGEIITKPYRRHDLARKLRSVLGLNP